MCENLAARNFYVYTVYILGSYADDEMFSCQIPRWHRVYLSVMSHKHLAGLIWHKCLGLSSMLSRSELSRGVAALPDCWQC